jgi:hypothetical protein
MEEMPLHIPERKNNFTGCEHIRYGGRFGGSRRKRDHQDPHRERFESGELLFIEVDGFQAAGVVHPKQTQIHARGYLGVGRHSLERDGVW